MSTFHTWLEDQREAGGPAGETARWWTGVTADRPRVYSPSGIQKYLDKELREGSLKDLDPAAKALMREQFADTVRLYHDRDKPEAARLDQDGSLKAFMAETREAFRMLRVRTDQIAAALGIDTPAGGIRMPPADRAGLLGPSGTHDGPPVPPGRREALEIRARMGDSTAAAELAAAGAQDAQDAPEPYPAYAGDPQGAGEALSDDLGAAPELSPEDWDLLWRVADRRFMSWSVDLPDDYAA